MTKYLKRAWSSVFQDTRGAVIVLVGLYFILTLPLFGSPGTIEETLIDEVRSLRWLQDFRTLGYPTDSFWGACPLYHGIITCYLILPVFYLLGNSWMIIKLWPLIFGALTIVMTTSFATRLFGSAIGLLAGLCLTVHPSFLMGTLAGQSPVSHMNFLSTGALYFLLRWKQERKSWNLYAGILLLTAGMGTRLWFWWFVIALACAGALFFGELGWSDERRKSHKTILLSLGHAALASLPVGYLVYQGIQRGLNDYGRIFSRVSGGLHLSALLDKLHEFNFMMSGQHYSWYCFGRTEFGPAIDFVPDPLFPYLLWGAVAWWILRGYRYREEPRIRKAYFILTMFLVIYSICSIMPNSRFYSFVIYPLPQIIVAAAFIDVAERFQRQWKRSAATVLLIGALVGFELRGYAQFRTQMDDTGAMGASTDSIYELMDWINHAQLKDTRLTILLPPGIGEHSRFFNTGTAQIMDIGYSPRNWERDRDILLETARKRNVIVVESISAWLNREQNQEFFEECRDIFDLKAEHEINERNGRPVFRLYRITPKARRERNDVP